MTGSEAAPAIPVLAMVGDPDAAGCQGDSCAVPTATAGDTGGIEDHQNGEATTHRGQGSTHSA